VVVPNKEIFNKPVMNHSSASRRRVDFEIKIPPDVDLDEALRLAHDAVSSIERRDRSQEIELFFKSVEDTGTTLLVRFWIDSANEVEYLRARSLGIQRIKAAIDRRQHVQHV
jgi:small-conductance mechanosensitive channel